MAVAPQSFRTEETCKSPAEVFTKAEAGVSEQPATIARRDHESAAWLRDEMTCQPTGRWRTATQLRVGRSSSCWTLGSGSTVTAAQLSRLDAKLDALLQPITVVVFSGERSKFVLQRHQELQVDRAGRPVRFEYRNQERDDDREMFVVHTPEELQPVMDRIEAKAMANR